MLIPDGDIYNIFQNCTRLPWLKWLIKLGI